MTSKKKAHVREQWKKCCVLEFESSFTHQVYDGMKQPIHYVCNTLLNSVSYSRIDLMKGSWMGPDVYFVSFVFPLNLKRITSLYHSLTCLGSSPSNSSISITSVFSILAINVPSPSPPLVIKSATSLTRLLLPLYRKEIMPYHLYCLC